MGDAYLETVYEPPLVPNSRSPTVELDLSFSPTLNILADTSLSVSLQFMDWVQIPNGPGQRMMSTGSRPLACFRRPYLQPES